MLDQQLGETLRNLCIKITQPFLILSKPQNVFHRIIKKIKTKLLFKKMRKSRIFWWFRCHECNISKYTVYIKESNPNLFLNSVWFSSSCGIYLASQGDVPDQTLTIWKWKDEAMVAKKPAPASEYYNLAFTHDNYTKITSCGVYLISRIYFFWIFNLAVHLSL